MKILKIGKRYEWPMTIPFDGRIKSGLFTGKYNEKNGNAILITNDHQRWSVPPENCRLVKKH